MPPELEQSSEGINQRTERDCRKNGRLEYLYLTPPDLSIYLLLGSCMRALGRPEWQVKIITDNQHHYDIFKKLESSLVDTNKLSVVKLVVKAEDIDPNDPFLQNTSSVDKHQLLLIDANSTSAVLVKRIRDHEAVLGRKNVMVAISNDPYSDDYDLISDHKVSTLHDTGVIAITGDGKNKTTLANGMALHHVLVRGQEADIIQWIKEERDDQWYIGEQKFPKQLSATTRPLLLVFPSGRGFCSGREKLDRLSSQDSEHRVGALEGLSAAAAAINKGRYVVLDEFVDTVPEIADNLPIFILQLHELREFLQYANNNSVMPVVVTGRRINTKWDEFVRQSIVITCNRHPYSLKKLARAGLDF